MVLSSKRTMADTPLTAGQVLRRLADLEQKGAAFYEALLNGTESEWVRKLARVMVRAEKRHRARFLDYARRAEAKNDALSNTLTQPLTPDLTRLLTVSVFASAPQAAKSVRYARDEDVLKVAIRAEESLALLLTQLRSYVPSEQRRYISRVIKEEWGHKDKLEKALRKYFG